MDQKHIVALELSGTQVKGAVATVSTHPNGAATFPTIETIVTEDNADCVQYGRVQNLINAAKFTNNVLDAMRREPSVDGSEIVCAYVGIGGRSLCSEQTTAVIDLPTEMEITQDILRSLFVEATKMASPNRKVMKVLPRKYVVDSQAMPNPVGALGKRLRGDFTLVTCNPINQRNLDLVLRDRVNLRVERYIVTPIAIAEMVLGEEEKQLGCALVDIGAQTTTVAIYKDRALQYIATLPIGSHNITRDISVGVNLTMEKAESAKCNLGDAMFQSGRGAGDDTSRINSYVTARAYELVTNIVANIGYANYTSDDLPGGFVLTGRGSKLTNLDNLLAEQSKMRVRHASVPGGVNFAFNTSTVNPDDYISLISIVAMAARKSDLADCLGKPEEETDTTEPRQPAQQAPQTQAWRQDEKPATANDNDDDNWDKDDPDPEEAQEEKKPAEKTEKPRRRSLVSILQDRINKLMSTDTDLDDDAQL